MTSDLLTAAMAMLDHAGEFADDGEFYPVPRASLSGEERSRIASREYRKAWFDLWSAIDDEMKR